MHGKSPKVHRLPVHLENCQNVIFDENEDIQKLIDSKKDTKLTAWFKANKQYEDFNHLAYYEYPKFFKYDKKSNSWILRSEKVRGKLKLIVRSYAVLPKDTERFYLRLVLKHLRGAKNWMDTLTYNQNTFNSYRDVAKEMQLLDDDSIWMDTMNEAILCMTPSKCRKIFSYILMYTQISDPLTLFNIFKKNLFEDFKYIHKSLNYSQLEDLAIASIDKILIDFDMRASQFGLLTNIINKSNYEYSDINFSDEDLFDTNFNLLTSEQKNIFTKIEKSLKGEINEKNYFIHSFGGSGKTFLLNTISVGMSMKNFKVLSVAHSGIAAILLKNGRTAHSLFKIPLKIDEYSICNITKNSDLAYFIKNCDLLIWDEVTMSSKYMVNCVEKLFKDLCGNQMPFGDKVVLFAGDFRQTLPIVRGGSFISSISESLKFSDVWKFCKIFQLTKNLRLDENDPSDYSSYLLDIGENKIEKNEFDNTIILKKELYFKGSIDQFIEQIFPLNFLNEYSIHLLYDNVILACLNDDVDNLNNRILDKFVSSKSKTYYSIDKVLDECENMDIDISVINKINQKGLPIYELKLKKGAIVILLRNLDPKNGLCNGTRMVVIDLLNNIIKCKILNGTFKSKIVEIPRIDLLSDDDQAVKFKRKQFPIRLAFSMTINKSQGQTFDNVGIFLINQCFTHGQLYVALTRSKSFFKTFVFTNNKNIVNIVFDDILIDKDIIENSS